jgi:maleylacetoacetate isomerase
MSMLRLLSRWQNSAGERVRIALHLKQLGFAYVPVSSLPAGTYSELNPQGLLPALDVDGRIIAQSSAILNYLEETYPASSLLPVDPVTRAEARAFGAFVTAEMHAITVQRVRRFLASDMAVDQAHVDLWGRHWMAIGLKALEKTLVQRGKDEPFCFGDAPGWADLHLVPQMSAARRLGCDLSAYPRLLAVERRCNDIDAFRRAKPEMQPDYPG